MNPNSTVPTIKDNVHTLVIGNTQSLYKYIVNKEPQVKKALYSEEQDKQIEEMLTWFDKQMRRTSVKIIRAVVNPLVFGANPKSMKEDVDTFFDQLVPRIEKKLTQHTYLTGWKMTYVDFMVYTDVKNVVLLS